MLVSDAAKKLGMNPQTLRLGLQQGKFPFGTAIKTSEKRYVYYINEKLLMGYLEGGVIDTQSSQSTSNILDHITWLWSTDSNRGTSRSTTK